MIVSFGEALIDLFGHPRGASVDEAEHFAPHLGGALANVALTCARLGIPVRFIGAVGRDGHGDRALRELDRAGVDTRCVMRVAERTAVTFVRVGDDGSRSFLFYRKGTADHALSPALLDAMRPHPLDGAAWLLTGTSALVAEPLASAYRQVVGEARARAIPRVIDLNVRAHLWNDTRVMQSAVRDAVEGAVVVKASEEDLCALGLEPRLDALCAFAPGALAVLTLAERGAVFAMGDRVFERPAVAVSATDFVDATGAGDAFIAGFLSVLMARGAAADAVRGDAALVCEAVDAGCALGAMAVTAMGATAGVRAPWPGAVAKALDARSFEVDGRRT
jgi:sugar/nucleoside kinase (ribokinase family)